MRYCVSLLNSQASTFQVLLIQKANVIYFKVAHAAAGMFSRKACTCSVIVLRSVSSITRMKNAELLQDVPGPQPSCCASCSNEPWNGSGLWSLYELPVRANKIFTGIRWAAFGFPHSPPAVQTTKKKLAIPISVPYYPPSMPIARPPKQNSFRRKSCPKISKLKPQMKTSGRASHVYVNIKWPLAQ